MVQGQPKQYKPDGSDTPVSAASEQAAMRQPTEAELMAQMDKAIKSGDYKAVAKVATEIAKVQKSKEQAELESKQKALAVMTEKVKGVIERALKPLIEAKELDAADGVWYTYDFGDKLTACRLMKSQPKGKTSTGTGGGGKKFDVATTPGSDLFEKFKGEAYKESGLTVQQAWDSDADKNKRYAIRQWLLKKGGVIS